jgi:hypothetical protein
MKQLELQKETAADPYILFEYTIRSPYTKESYFRRLRRFFNAISLEGPTFESRCNLFVENGRQDPNWAFNSILKFVLEEKKRVEKKEITGGTLRNSVKTIKTFCEVTDVLIPWKKITRGLPGTKVMLQKKDLIKYDKLEMKNGSSLILTTNDRQLIDAINHFMKFQARQHPGSLVIVKLILA